MSETHEGGCLCGAVRYVATGAPSRSGICHCRMCQRATGQPMVAGAVFAKTAISVKGETRAYQSSSRARRHFCPTCGSPLFFEPLDQPEHLEVWLGTLDDPARIEPAYHIFCASQVPWLAIQDDRPRHAEWRVPKPA